MQRPYSAQHSNDKSNCPAAKKLKAITILLSKN